MFWIARSSWWTFVWQAFSVCRCWTYLKLFRTDLRILREFLAYPIKPANNSSSKEGLVD